MSKEHEFLKSYLDEFPEPKPAMKAVKAEVVALLDEFFRGEYEGENGHWKDLLWFLGLPQEMGFNSVPKRKRRFINAMLSKDGLYSPTLGTNINTRNLREVIDRIKKLYRSRKETLGKQPHSNDLYPYKDIVGRLKDEAARKAEETSQLD